MSNGRIWIISLFPEIIYSYFSIGVMSRYKHLITVVNPADYSEKGFKGVDSSPFGGGPGMVMRVDVLSRAIENGIFSKYSEPKKNLKVIFTSPDGAKWTAANAKKMSRNLYLDEDKKDLVFVCGRYEGIDQRFIELYVEDCFSLGDFVLSGGELAVMSMIDSALRFVPGVLGNSLSYEEDSFENGYYDHPKWTKPRIFNGEKVPDVLLSGNHREIKSFNESFKKVVKS